MRPNVRFLSDELLERILNEAVELLGEVGVEIHNHRVLGLLADHGVEVNLDRRRAVLKADVIQKALASAPNAFRLYDIFGEEANDFSGDKVHFTPGSAAINILEYPTNRIRKPTTADYIRYVKVADQLEYLASQSTALIPADVPEPISDSYRLFLSLLYGRKPVVTGAFTVESFAVMHALQMAVRGSAAALREKPLTVFSCCPTSPLKWSEVTSQNVLDCARHSIPVEFIAMPLSGFMAPVTLVGTLIQHTAETLSGIVISQLANPGTPLLYGGSPAVFDVRYETTPMGAIETMMLDCAYSEIGKHLGLPTQAYISLSDAKLLDAQAGLESGIGAVLAALAGVNNISGPGMLDFESCQSLEKLVLDNEICGMALRLVRGMEPREDFPILPRIQELLQNQHLLISDHTRKYLREEHLFPGPVIDRAHRSRWQEEGALTLGERAHREVQRLIEQYEPTELSPSVRRDLIDLMTTEAQRYGLETLPIQE
jgi:trimethylamine--corrinoid protein Co-methyltransferase